MVAANVRFEGGLEDKARKQSNRPSSGFHKRAAPTYVLRTQTAEIPLDKPELIIGRSSTCDVVLASSLVSRRHARLLLTDAGLFVEDLGSRNGILVNTTLVRGSARLSTGDRVRVGPEIFQVIERPEPSHSGVPPARVEAPPIARDSVPPLSAERFSADGLLEPTPRPSTVVPRLGRLDVDDATRRADVLELLSSVIEQAFASGAPEQAEQLLSSHLNARLKEARRSGAVPADMALRAARYAVRLAALTGKASWLDYVIALYIPLAQPLPLALVDEMYTLLRRVRGMDRTLLREYVSVLRFNAERYDPTERFALQRVEGLERLAGL